MRRPALPAILLAALAAAGAAAGQEAAPFPPGTSSQSLEGLRCSVVMPAEFDPAKERSLVVVLHGAGGTETGMAGSLAFLAERECAVLAPKSRGQTWDKPDVDAVRRIVADLKKRLRVGNRRLHALGFSNGGWNLAPLAFDEDLGFATACWVAAGYSGGKPPDRAKKTMAVLALAGEKDPNRGAAEKTPDLLKDKVRSAEARVEPGIGHEWPAGQMPYYGWWLGLQEGRFVPGETLAFAWSDDEGAARAAMAERRTGALVYWFSKEDADRPEARTLQNETLQDPMVRVFGGRLLAWRRDRAGDAAGFAAAGLKETPAVVVLDAAGKPVKTLQGKISAQALAAALRSVARDKSVPK